MRILFVSFSDFRGGAAIAAGSLFKLIKSKKKKFLTAEKKKKFSFQIFNFLGYYKITILRIIEKILIFLILKKKISPIIKHFQYKSL